MMAAEEGSVGINKPRTYKTCAAFTDENVQEMVVNVCCPRGIKGTYKIRAVEIITVVLDHSESITGMFVGKQNLRVEDSDVPNVPLLEEAGAKEMSICARCGSFAVLIANTSCNICEVGNP